jgi:nucleoid DNA-binding protein
MAAKPKKLTAVRDPYTKARLFAAISEETGLSKKDVATVYESLAGIMHRHLKKRAVGAFTLPGLAKFTVVAKKATKAHSRANPFAPGEMMDVAAKPARRVVRIRALKGVKEMAESS